MWWFGRKALRVLAVLLCVTLLSFVGVTLLPGDLAVALLGEEATPADVAALREQLGLNDPVLRQYVRWLERALAGDLGRSFRTGEPVTASILDRLPVSLELMILAQGLALAIAVPLGVASAWRAGGLLDRVSGGVAFGALSMPHFVMGILLIYFFAVELKLLPATGFAALDEGLGPNLRSLALPAITLALAEWPVLMRVLRADMIATLKEDFILLARAKGLPPWRVLLVHALRPSSFTLMTVTGLNIGHLIGGALIVETIFALPGIGRLLVGAIYNRDLVLVQGVVSFVAVAFVLVNFTVDLLYGALDPRVRHGHAGR